MLNRTKLKKAEKRANKNPHKASAEAKGFHVCYFFDPSKGKLGRDGWGNLYLRAKYDGEIAQITMSVHCKREHVHYQHNAAPVIEGNPAATELLAHRRQEILAIFTDRYITGRGLSPRTILQIAQGLRGHDEDIPTVVEAIYLFVAEKRKLKGNGIASLTVQRYDQHARILERYFVAKHGKNCALDVLKPALGTDLLTYFKGECLYSQNYARKIVEFLRGVLEYAYAQEWVDRNVLRHFTLRKERKEVVALTEKEVQRLLDVDFVSDALGRSRDRFLFQCFTGLAYADLHSLRMEHIHRHESGAWYAEKPRQKTNVKQFIPLIDAARYLIEKYEQDPCRRFGLVFPPLSNQLFNQHLRSVGQIAGIKMKLHSHLGRKTCTSLFIINGVPKETTLRVVGFTEAIMNEHYLANRPEVVLDHVLSKMEGKFTVTRKTA